jgi:hypothetical protein
MTFIILRKIVWRRGVENNISFQPSSKKSVYVRNILNFFNNQSILNNKNESILNNKNDKKEFKLVRKKKLAHL